ncbi:34394_t:CDS:1, partial [Racocetra persica]
MSNAQEKRVLSACVTLLKKEPLGTLFVYNNEKTTYGFIGESWYELTESGWKSVIDNENLKQQFVHSTFK